MKFRSEVKIDASTIKIGHKQPVFASGSCFATHIGKRLEEVKFDLSLNPFGIVYNPISLSRQYDLLLKKEAIDEARFLEHQDRTLHFDFHSELWGSSREDWKAKYIDILKEGHSKKERRVDGQAIANQWSK